jgi:flagellar basal body L-ring protein FlgH
MALSMDEQRMLAEIEQRLAAEDPGLAARMSSFRRPSRVNIFRSARARVIGSLLTVVVVAVVSLLVYAILPFRSNNARTIGGHPVASRGQPVMTVASSGPGGAKTGTGKAGSSTARAATGTKVRQSPASGATTARTSGTAPAAAHPGSTASAAVHGP